MGTTKDFGCRHFFSKSLKQLYRQFAKCNLYIPMRCDISNLSYLLKQFIIYENNTLFYFFHDLDFSKSYCSS